jgi:acetoin utilization deacetylase AcuC-like enzyme
VFERFSLDGGRPERATALIWHELFLWYDAGVAGPPGSSDLAVEPGEISEESPEPRRRLRSLIDVSGLLAHLEVVPPREATREELAEVHTSAYLRRVVAASANPASASSIIS